MALPQGIGIRRATVGDAEALGHLHLDVWDRSVRSRTTLCSVPLYSFEGRSPSVHPTALVAPSADLIGDVTVEARASVWFGAAGALVTGGTEIPDGVLAIGSPARVMGPIEGTNAEAWVAGNPAAYQELAQRYLAGFGGA